MPVSICAFFQVSAFNAVFVILLAVALPSHKLQKVMNYFFVVWASVIVLALMFYQLRFVDENILKYNCTESGPVVSILFQSLVYSTYRCR